VNTLSGSWIAALDSRTPKPVIGTCDHRGRVHLAGPERIPVALEVAVQYSVAQVTVFDACAVFVGPANTLVEQPLLLQFIQRKELARALCLLAQIWLRARIPVVALHRVRCDFTRLLLGAHVVGALIAVVAAAAIALTVRTGRPALQPGTELLADGVTHCGVARVHARVVLSTFATGTAASIGPALFMRALGKTARFLVADFLGV